MTSKVLICAIGAKGAIGTTIASGICAFKKFSKEYDKYLVTNPMISDVFGKTEEMEFSGWEQQEISYEIAYNRSKTFSKELFLEIKDGLDKIKVFKAPDPEISIKEQIIQIKANISELREIYPEHSIILVNILPGSDIDYENSKYLTWEELKSLKGVTYQDLAYLIASIEEGIPFANFTPNPIELPCVVENAIKKGVPICGRDGKSGQTYFKVVLASGFKARELIVNSWYSTNILGNNDGKTLNDPCKRINKINAKKDVLNNVLGYEVNDHLVRIDYFKPRGDFKEAWDVIDFKGFLHESMSMRVNLQGKDSILAAPMIIDLCRWLNYAKSQKISGAVSELAFYFKSPIGEHNYFDFSDQLAALRSLL
jgi:myo-inositol-1-phosphate synthase